jgi:hypothetical protein
MKFGAAKVIPYISIEGPANQPPRAAKSQSNADEPVERTPQMREYDEMAELARNDITSFVAEGRNIRAEVEGLIVWRRDMGEASAAPTWGPIQQAHAAYWIEYQRARLAKLKSDIETDGKNAAEIIEYIFGEQNRGRYDEAVTKQAREELGIGVSQSRAS